MFRHASLNWDVGVRGWSWMGGVNSESYMMQSCLYVAVLRYSSIGQPDMSEEWDMYLVLPGGLL